VKSEKNVINKLYLVELSESIEVGCNVISTPIHLFPMTKTTRKRQMNDPRKQSWLAVRQKCGR
jgi:hypothetical protein